MKKHHFLLISLPAQGHINPTIQLARKLIGAGAKATFATTVYGLRQMKSLPAVDGLSYASFSDGHDDKITWTGKPDYMEELKRVGSKNLINLLRTLSGDGQQVTFLVYTILLPWAAEVAREMHVPSAFLSIQSATSFLIYHRFFNRHDGIHKNIADPSISLNLPGLPLFMGNDIPTFLFPGNPFYSFMVPVLQEHIKALEEGPNSCVLVNSFDALEEDSIKSMNPHLNIIPIGPLLDQKDKSLGCDLFQSSNDLYLQWLDSKPPCTVVYVSFGSLAALQKKQKEEIFQGLKEVGLPYLWVIRDQEDEEIGFNQSVENGLIVNWCSQVEVLSHRAIGCFVTHCGWNSTVESLVAGVPLVGCPQFSDQITNAKMVEEVWGNGVRAVADGEGVVMREEIKRCLEVVVMGGGERGEVIKRNVVKWKTLANEAVKDGGSSYHNLEKFLGRLV